MWSDNESTEDLLGFEYLAGAAVSIVKNENLLPATIGVFGDWGGGKSTLIEIVRTQLTSEEERKAGTVVLSFNGWLFEGYEGAKTALMGTILEELKEHETFKNKASAKAKKLLKSLFRRVDWMKSTLGVGKLVAAHFAGPAAPAFLIGGVADIASVAREAAKKVEDIDPKEVKEYIKEEDKDADKDEPETRRQIQNFRKDFEELLKEAGITRLVITIDDLDRCSPDTIIPTLEAIKLFLFVPRTAFIIGADEELVRYAVRRRFPELPGDRREVGRDYLEKLIQFPIRIPALGRAEVESYMGLLFATASKDLTPEQKKLVRAKIGEASTEALTTACFNISVARELLKPLPQLLEDDLGMVERVAPLLGTIMNGNPRQCKRFLNTLLLRLEMARSKGITLKQRVLAKLMLLEYFRTEAFRRLAEIQFAQDGTPKELGDMEKAIRPRNDAQQIKEAELQTVSDAPKKSPAKKAAPPDANELSPEFALWIADPWIREWLSMEPALAGEDLRSYYFFSRDNLGLLGTAGQRLSLAARKVLDKLKSSSNAVRLAGLKELKESSEADANAVFEALVERAKREEDLGAQSASLKPMIDAAQERPALLLQLITAVKALPERTLPLWAPVSIQNACKGHPDAERAFKEILATWSKSTVNVPLASAAKTTLAALSTAS
ncbi:MAG: KAP family NTPase [Acidobacteriia bacterium]|nr:KAP family NTPase [Terriglobia bacterium]